MAIDFVVPSVGESVSEGVVTRWLQPLGARVDADAPLVEIETDKVTVEVPAPLAGVLVAQHVQAGEVVRVGQRLGAIDEAAPGVSPDMPPETVRSRGRTPPRGS